MRASRTTIRSVGTRAVAQPARSGSVTSTNPVGRGWDPILVALSAYIVVSLGRIHQLIPILAVLKPAALTGGATLVLLFISRRPMVAWTQLDKRWRFLVLAIAGWAMASIPLSLYAGLSFNWWKDVVLQSCGLAFIVAMSIRSVGDARRLVSAFVLATAFYAIMILAQYGTDLNERFSGLYSYDTNDFAQVVVCCLPLAIFLALESRRVLTRMAYWLTVGLFLVIIIKSGSRGGFLGLVAVGGAALVSWKAIGVKWRVGAVAGAILFLTLFASEMFWSRVASIADPGDDYNVTEDTGRIQAWKRGLGYMMDNPVLGVGVGAFGVAEGTISDLAIRARHTAGPGIKWMAPHNSFVEIGAETGIPGLLIFLGLVTVLLRRSYAMTATTRLIGTDSVPLLAGALFLSLIGFYVTAFFLSQAYSGILFLLAGLVAGLLRINDRSRQS